MRSCGNNFNYFPENQLTKLARLVQFKRLFVLFGDWRKDTAPSLSYATAVVRYYLACGGPFCEGTCSDKRLYR